MKNEIEKILHPNAVIPVKHNGNLVSPDVMRQVVIFVFQYFAVFAVTATIITIIEQNHTLGLTSAITSLGNIGRENFAMNQINTDRSRRYYGDLSGNAGGYKRKCGGKLKK